MNKNEQTHSSPILKKKDVFKFQNVKGSSGNIHYEEEFNQTH